MGIDVSRFREAFFDESEEGLATMESGLLALESGQADEDTLHAVFRAAHSIKGGAATFGFPDIAEVTHHLESLLDAARSGQRALGGAEIDALLGAADCVRRQIEAARAGEQIDAALLDPVLRTLEGLQQGGAEPAPVVAPATADTPAQAGWDIHFVPEPDLLRTGNDPIAILRELHRLGACAVRCDASALPALDALTPDALYLDWRVALTGEASESAVREIFAWVEDDCALTVAPLAAAAVDGDRADTAPAVEVEDAAEPGEPPVDATAPSSVTAPVEAAAPEPARARVSTIEQASIRVPVDKVDALINLVGELVITQAAIAQDSAGLDPVEHERLLNGLAELERNTRHLQEAVMSVRMMPVGTVFSRFPRMVRDLAGKLGKQVRLQMAGEATELDKGLIERLVDPLTHLVRNAVDHGIETPEARRAAGKPAAGTLSLAARHESGQVVLEITDDGAGLSRERIVAKARERGLITAEPATDAEVWQLIFEPGFSTADQVTDVSGRGVGMDVVRKNINALSGRMDVSSSLGEGTRLSIRLPLTLAILDGMQVAVGDQIFVLPLGEVIESMQPRPADIEGVAGRPSLLRMRGEFVPILPLRDLMHVDGEAPPLTEAIAVLVEAEGRRAALIVDELIGQQQAVVKSLTTNFRRVDGIAGATILGDGRVALILDVADIVRGMRRAQAA
ncbi:chemotaxis protein CheA [Algiphilus sp.]|uniref:chemotaxis protein CheA n=1 Tax=Algiphilus sp. TaxID=1872431 RepID=UPI0025B8FA47|nr:chemotaxis protein CheA [Algiphilus sp.]MCK5771040.1 chemotaxis protein CheA [Algiphilus sp.]